MNDVISKTFAQRSSLKKAQEVASLIRRLPARQALIVLEHTPRRAALLFDKQLRSTMANATNNHGLSEESLIISGIDVSGGGAIKRYRAGARGMAKPIRRQLVNITIQLQGDIRAKEDKTTAKTSRKSKPKGAGSASTKKGKKS